VKALFAFAIAMCAGCSAGLYPPELHPLEPGPALAIVAPHEADVVYTEADDEALDVEGIQITLRVDVRDEAIQYVLLRQAEEEQDDVVGEDLDGNRAALFEITLAPAANTLIARAPDVDFEASATLTAR
jgi:hypothetical protein